MNGTAARPCDGFGRRFQGFPVHDLSACKTILVSVQNDPVLAFPLKARYTFFIPVLIVQIRVRRESGAQKEDMKMDAGTIVEIIGYLGSALVLVSMLMTSVIKLRIINLTGSVIFAAYALMIRSYPTAVMNICLAGVNVYHLWRLTREKKHYELIPASMRDAFVAFLLQSSETDIRKFFPSFSAGESGADLVYLMCCDGNPAGLFLGRRMENGEVEVLLDYALPVYRDTSVGRFLYQRMAQEGFRSLIFRQNAPEHTPYLEKMGYRKTGGGFTLDLSRYK
jgi:hypothetical protein